jgi:hypothetical protein
MLALLTLDLQNQTVTLLDIVVTPQGGFELNIIGLCPPILSVLHSVFIPTIIPRMIGLSPGTHLQMTSPFECILQSIAAPPSPPSSWGSRNISAVVGVDVGAVSGAAAVGTLVMLLLLLLLCQRWRRHRKAMLKEPHLAQGLRARHTEMMALKLPMEIVQAKLVLAKLPEKQHELKPSYTHALPPRPRNPATVRRGDGAAMTELPKMGVPVFIVSQPRRERFVSVGTQTTLCEQERSMLSEVLFEPPNLKQHRLAVITDVANLMRITPTSARVRAPSSVPPLKAALLAVLPEALKAAPIAAAAALVTAGPGRARRRARRRLQRQHRGGRPARSCLGLSTTYGPRLQPI